jgi:PKHD-type hydroxylase
VPPGEASNVKVIPKVLCAEELSAVRALISRGKPEDGAGSALGLARSVKANQQFALDQKDAQSLAELTFGALKRSQLFYRYALPIDVSMPMANRYAKGMCYGPHYDSSVMPSPNGNEIRTDFSATLFISEPDEYVGGELSFEWSGARQRVKLAAGDMLLYPAGLLHEVEPVTQGERHAVVFWAQSKIGQEDRRKLLFRLDEAVGSLAHKHPESPEVRELLGVFQNLSRMWIR